MAGSNRRFALGAFALSLLFVAMSGVARANTIVVDTTATGSIADHCSLDDAIIAINLQLPVNGCAGGTSDNDEIVFSVTGQIILDHTLNIEGPETLVIFGPPAGGISINGADEFEIFNAESDTEVSLYNLELTDGSAPEGGAIYENGNSLVAEECLFDNNVATDTVGGKGGAIFVNSSATVVLLNDTFASNTAVHGTTGSAGGGIADMNASSTLDITNTTFWGNSADGGNAFAAMFHPLARGTLFSHNAAHPTGSNCATMGVSNQGFNISDDTTCGTVLHANPLLDTSGLANNGGPTDTILLLSGSPAIGLDTNCKDIATGDTVGIDQRGFGRPNSPTMCDSGAYESDGTAPFVLIPGTERVQISRSSGGTDDQVNLALSFSTNGNPGCFDGQNVLTSGLIVQLFAGTCADYSGPGLDVNLNPFQVHTVNHQSYGTFFSSSSPETVSARMVQIEGASANSCGEWTLNLEVAGLNTASLGLGGGNPFALVLTNEDDDTISSCFDVDNAITGGQIPKVVIPVVRKGARR